MITPNTTFISSVFKPGYISVASTVKLWVLRAPEWQCFAHFGTLLSCLQPKCLNAPVELHLSAAGVQSPGLWTLPQLSVTVRHQDQRSRRAAVAQNRAGPDYTLKWPQFLFWTRAQGPAQLQLSSGFRTSHRRWIQTQVLPRFPPTAGSSLQNKSAEGQWVLQQGPVGEEGPVLIWRVAPQSDGSGRGAVMDVVCRNVCNLISAALNHFNKARVLQVH